MCHVKFRNNMNNNNHHHENINSSEQQQQQEQQRYQEAVQQAVQNFAGQYEVQLEWPANIMNVSSSSNNNKSNNTKCKTSNELIQHRLLEAGILYDVPMSTKDIVEASSKFIANLERSDCYHTIQVEIGSSTSENNISSSNIEQPQQQDNSNSDNNESSNSDPTIKLRRLNVTLEEKNWYKLHAGAGLKTDGLWNSTSGGASASGIGSSTSTTSTVDTFIPTAEMELRAGLRNILGVLDRTDIQYTLNTNNIGSWDITHIRPLYTILPSLLSDIVLLRPTGSQYTFVSRATLDTCDRIAISSYQEYQRLVSIKASTSEHQGNNNNNNSSTESPWYSSIECGILYRDVIPKRHVSMPYHFMASSDVVSQAGPSIKHFISHVLSYNNVRTDSSHLPVHGVQMNCTTEIALPPGDVGYIKGQGAIATHVSVLDRIAFHGSVSGGYLHSVSYGGLCNPSSHISDRFLLGGVGSFRGFIPAGIGPRSSNRSSTNSRRTGGLSGDALGGNFFYTATAMTSIAPPDRIEGISQIVRNIRLFGFATVGSCVTIHPNITTTNIRDIIGSSRISAGVGIASGGFGPRIEATYAIPLRYSPVDGRRRFQLGLSVSIT